MSDVYRNRSLAPIVRDLKQIDSILTYCSLQLPVLLIAARRAFIQARCHWHREIQRRSHGSRDDTSCESSIVRPRDV